MDSNFLLCNICNNIKYIDCFGVDNSRKNGRKPFCKECEKQRYTKICPVCGIEFKTSSTKTECCSRICSGIKRRNRIAVKCEICGKETTISKYQYERSEHHYCSVECMGKGESVFHVGENAKNYKGGGVVCECDVCGKEIVKSVAEYKKYRNHYCSKECRYRGVTIYNSGINSPKYNNTLTPEERDRYRNIQGYNIWRKEVYERDEYTCQCCKKQKSGFLIAHHLDGFKENIELRTDINNGITLCDECHNDFHKVYGRGGNTRAQYIEYSKCKGNIEEQDIFKKDNIKIFNSICVICGMKFENTVESRKTCSKECARILSGNSIKCNCDICGKELLIKKSVYDKYEHHYCSIQCKNKGASLFYNGKNNSNNKKIEIQCEVCSKMISITPSRLNASKHHYCSRECQNIGYSMFVKGENNPRMKKAILKCDVCQKEIMLPPNRLKSKHHYCSRDCQFKGQSIFMNSKI